MAAEQGLDLVEISPTAKPPVCKIIDYKKFLYEKKKKEKEIKARTAKTVIKEIRFTPNTDDHDFDFKRKHAEKFLNEGAKVKICTTPTTEVFDEDGNVIKVENLHFIEVSYFTYQNFTLR